MIAPDQGNGRIVVIVNDKGRGPLPTDPSVDILPWPDAEIGASTRVIVLTSISELDEVAEVVRVANRDHRLKALLVREDADAKLLPQILDLTKLRTLRHTLVYSGMEVPGRVINAWRFGAQKQLVATASVVAENLMVVSCALEAFEIPFDSIAALRSIASNRRNDFRISSEGSYIHWPDQDIHLDLDAFRYATDPKWRSRKDLERLSHDEAFGEAIAVVRKDQELRQTDIHGLSARQVRRIERGARVTPSALAALAAAHEMNANQYLDKIAFAMNE